MIVEILAAALVAVASHAAPRPAVVPGPVCAVLDTGANPGVVDGLTIGEDAYFKPECADCFSAPADLLFEFNSSRLRPAALPLLREWAVCLARETGVFSVDGHADAVGSDAYNLRLSIARANSVRDELVRNGVWSDMLVVRGFGESRPVASNLTASGRARNRRVEVNRKVD
jgi:outer membrane protein OmpA-like peptidoglycan-associated protein